MPADWTSALTLSRAEWETLTAIADAVVPGSPDDPGAVDADCVLYVDRSLAGAYAALTPIYRAGLHQLDALAETREGSRFAALALEERVGLLSELSLIFFGAQEADGVSPELAEFAEQAREHVLEGLFADPLYGGNRDLIGWKLIGFPGAQWGYSPDQRAFGFDASKIPPKTLAELVAETDGSAR